MIMVMVAFLLGMILCLLFGVPYISFLKKKMIGQYVKDVAPEAHQQKEGTPTTGGVFIITAGCYCISYCIGACTKIIRRSFHNFNNVFVLYFCRISG